MSDERVIKEILSKKDPQGYYVLPAVNSAELQRVLEGYVKLGVQAYYYGDVALIRCRSRRMAEEIARKLHSKGLLKLSKK
ncbi:MAG: hypothetical protein LM553_00055 [Desulfurococcaceae archaeon]|nr:hypothetical protein [Desulfurococcaceae archaeon]